MQWLVRGQVNRPRSQAHLLAAIDHHLGSVSGQPVSAG